MDWIVLSIFKSDKGWIPSFVRSPGQRFRSADADYVHDRSRVNSSRSDWLDFAKHGLRGWFTAQRCSRQAGIMTVFPQLALIVGLLKRVSFSRRPVIAWMFNLGRTYHGVQGLVSRFGFAAIDRFVVHSRDEIDVYAGWLRLPRDRFVFVPLSVAEHPITESEQRDRPFLLSMGSANRDYALLFEAIADLPIDAVIVAGPHAVAGLVVPPNVEIKSGLTEVECRVLCQRARLCVVPLRDGRTATGQVTVIEAMMSGRPLVATRSVGTADYVQNEIDGTLVAPGDVSALRVAISDLWHDAAKRQSFAAAAHHSALTKFTFRAVASHLEKLVDDLSGSDEPSNRPVVS